MYAKTPHQTDQGSWTREGLDLRSTLQDGLQVPLAALQASLEELAKDFPSGDPRAVTLENTVRSIVGLAHRVQSLADFAADPPHAPLPCSLEELARSAYRNTPVELRGQVHLAVEDSNQRVLLDGPLCSRLLSYLIRACTESHFEVLLHVRATHEEAIFNLVTSPVPAGTTRAPISEDTSNQGANDMVLVVAERELVRMGGRVERSQSTNGGQCISVRLPLAGVAEEAA